MPEQTHFEGPRIFEPLGKGKESATEPRSEFSVRPPQPRVRPTGGGTADLFGYWFDPHRTDRFRMPPQTHSGKIPGICGSGVAGKETGENLFWRLKTGPCRIRAFLEVFR